MLRARYCDGLTDAAFQKNQDRVDATDMEDLKGVQLSVQPHVMLCYVTLGYVMV